jgi:carboxymethylenebutenolidase
MSHAPTPRPTAADFQPEVLQLFDQYVHGDLSRRGFLDRAAVFAGSPAAAAGLLAALSPQFAAAQVVKPDDARIATRRASFPSPEGHGTVQGLLARPMQPAGPRPAVLVVHENRGLNPHIEDITRRLAVEGFLAFAPDALAAYGGYPGNEDDARAAFAKVDQTKARADFIAGARALRALPESTGKLGVVGFCYGGGMANYLATQLPELNAAVPFYGGHAPAAEVPKIQAPLLIHFASDDPRINAGWPAYQEALKTAGKRFDVHIYPNTQHGFHNDTTPRFDAAAAQLAWTRTLAFFREHLG